MDRKTRQIWTINRHLRAGIDQIDEGMVFLHADPDGESEPSIIFVNRGISAMSGFRGEDLLGCPLSTLFAGEKLELLLRCLPAIAESGGVFEVSSPLACEDGTSVPARWKVSSVKDDDGDLVNFLLTVAPLSNGDGATTGIGESSGDGAHAVAGGEEIGDRVIDGADVAEDHGRVATLQDDEIEVRVIDGEDTGENGEQMRSARMETLALLAGGIAHDFKNLLTPVKGNLSMVQRELHDEPFIQEIDDAKKAAEGACRMAEQLLSFARGGDKGGRVEADVGRLLREAARLSTYGSKAKCEVIVDEQRWSAAINVTQITQVINNLIINARQAMGDVGTVQARLSNEQLTPGEIEGLPPGVYLRLDVIDHGCGIPADKLDDIFQPFYTTKERGNGIGLATCQSIVREHGGVINVSSEEGRGSCFSVYVPATGELVEPEEAKVQSEVYQGEGSVLVIDDDRLILRLAQSMLARLGYDVVCASSGEEGVAKYRRSRSEGKPFGAVLMDMTLPGGIDGNEATDQILAIDPQASVVASSGYFYEDMTEEQRRRGYVGILSKPYDLEEVSRAMREVFEMGGRLD